VTLLPHPGGYCFALDDAPAFPMRFSMCGKEGFMHKSRLISGAISKLPPRDGTEDLDDDL
jgi:hypothetical protein